MLLSNVGLPRLVARTEQQYVELARAMAGELPKLSAVRAVRGIDSGAAPSPIFPASPATWAKRT